MSVLRELGKLLEEFANAELVEIGNKPEGAEVRIKCVLNAQRAPRVARYPTCFRRGIRVS